MAETIGTSNSDNLSTVGTGTGERDVATGRYSEIVGVEKAVEYFDAVDDCKRKNLEFSIATSHRNYGSVALRSTARLGSPFFD